MSVRLVGTRPPEYQKTQTYIYNPSSLAWEAATGSLSDGSSVEITNFPASQTVVVTEDNKAVVLYENGDVLYVCKAAIGSSLSSAVWQIKKVDASSGVVVTWCGGNANYDNSATDLTTVAAYSYS